MMSEREEAKVAAEEFRQQHHLGNQPLGDLVELVQRTTGHDVAVLDAPPSDHGLTMYDPTRDKYIIGVARTRRPMRQRSTIAHELAHIIFRDSSPDLGSHESQEIRADAFAQHLLVPQKGLEELLGKKNQAATKVLLGKVVRHFLVSPPMAAIALRDARYIKHANAQKWSSCTTRHLAWKFGWNDYYTSLQESSNQLRAPQRLLARAIAGYEAGVLSAQAIATLKGTTEKEVREELSSIGIIPESLSWEEFEAADLPDVDVDLSDLDEETEAAS